MRKIFWVELIGKRKREQRRQGGGPFGLEEIES